MRMDSIERVSYGLLTQWLSGWSLCFLEQDSSVYWEDWGEGLAGKSLPVLCVADLVKESISVLQGVPSDVSPGQVRRKGTSHTHTHTSSVLTH